MAKRKISKKKITKFIILIILIIAVIIGTILFLNKDKDEAKTVKPKSIDKIEGYNYTLSENSTKYYKKLFKQLKDVLEADDVSESNYADLVAKLFVADFYNLDNKANKNDIGGTQFVYKNYRLDFEKLASSTIYKSVENNTYNNRKQELPVVNNVSTEAKDNTSFKYGENTDDKAYVISFTIEYDKDLGYQTEGILTLIHNGKKLEIAALEEANAN